MLLADVEQNDSASNATYRQSVFQRVQQFGEGPKSLRAFCFAGGVAIVIISALQIINFISLVFDPAAYLLNFCIIILGLCIMSIESKDISVQCKQFFVEWCKFLTVPLGKGFVYVFIGLLLMSQSFLLFSPSFLVGGYMVCMGCLCVCFHPHAKEEGYTNETGNR